VDDGRRPRKKIACVIPARRYDHWLEVLASFNLMDREGYLDDGRATLMAPCARWLAGGQPIWSKSAEPRIGCEQKLMEKKRRNARRVADEIGWKRVRGDAAR